MDGQKSTGKPGGCSIPDQVQAIYLAQANIFSYEARKAAKSWVPLCDSTVPISILYDNTRAIYRIISVDADIKEVVVNTTIIPDLEFVKTTQKFGYWKDVASGRVFGIGFASEYEAEAFDECLRKVKQNIGGSAPSSSSLTTDSHHSVAALPGQDDKEHGSVASSTVKLASTSTQQARAVPPKKPVNWDDYDQVGPTVLSFMNARSSPFDRPGTYKVVDLPSITPPGGTAVPSAYSLPPPGYSYYPEQSSTGPLPPPAILPMTIPHSFCYQGPPGGAGDTSIHPVVPPTVDLSEELHRLKCENLKLSESLMETTVNSKKLELQANSLREDNIQLVKSVGDLTSKLEGASKESREYKEQAGRWKDHYQQAVTSAKEKSQGLKDAEERVKVLTGEKLRLELTIKELEEEIKRLKELQTLNSQNVGQFGTKYFKELEDHYRRLLNDSQKRIEEVLRKDGDRKNVLRGVDTLFTGAIQGLINIHGQIRQAYEQQ